MTDTTEQRDGHQSDAHQADAEQAAAEAAAARERRNAYKRAWYAANRERISQEQKHRYATDPEYRGKILSRSKTIFRAFDLKRRFGISLEYYDQMSTRQHGICAICWKAPVAKALCLDHDHANELLRGLICHKCNLGLGYFRDDPDVLRRAADYIEFWKAHHEAILRGDPAMLHTATRLRALLNIDMARLLPPAGGAPAIAATRASPPLITAIARTVTPITIVPSANLRGASMSNHDPTEGNKAARMMRRAILHELQQPSSADAATDKLQAVARSLVDKAAGGDLSAIKEVLDRIDGKTPTAASEIDDTSKQVSVQWQTLS
jgi:Recombination endonuclease VII